MKLDISKLLAAVEFDNRSPLYAQIATAISDRIKDSTMPPGTRLPSERELAKLLNVSRTTVINAYRLLEQEDRVSIRMGSGAYVAAPCRETLPECAQYQWHQIVRPYQNAAVAASILELIRHTTSSDRITLDAGVPDPALYPMPVMRRILSDHADNIKPEDFSYLSLEGYGPLRETLADFVKSKTITALPQNIMVTSGSQQALYLLAKVLIEPGDCVIVEAPTYMGVHHLLQEAGAKVLSLPLTDDGSMLQLFEMYLVKHRPKFFYTIPTFQNPSGHVVSEAVRNQILLLAWHHRLVILEDDPYSDFYYDRTPPKSYKALDRYNSVVYISTFSKTLMPGLRLGYLVADAVLVDRLSLEKQHIDLQSNNFSQWLMNLFLKQGHFERHLEEMRQVYRARRDALYEALSSRLGSALEITLPEGGFYLWCKIRNSAATDWLLYEALQAGVSFVPGDVFYLTAPDKKHFRLCFTSNGESRLIEAAERLSGAFSNLDGSASPDFASAHLPLV